MQAQYIEPKSGKLLATCQPFESLSSRVEVRISDLGAAAVVCQKDGDDFGLPPEGALMLDKAATAYLCTRFTPARIEAYFGRRISSFARAAERRGDTRLRVFPHSLDVIMHEARELRLV